MYVGSDIGVRPAGEEIEYLRKAQIIRRKEEVYDSLSLKNINQNFHLLQDARQRFRVYAQHLAVRSND